MRQKKVLFVQHGDVDKPGLLGEVLSGLGVPMDVVRSDREGLRTVDFEQYSGLALGGGPQGVYEQDLYPYLADECDLVRQAQSTDRPVIGLCLGAQIMAAALGAEVRKAPRREVGFHEVTLDPISRYDQVWGGLPDTFVATHWHGDTFDIPAGGMRLASSAMTLNQLFRYGHALYGVQFHLEMTPNILEQMVQSGRGYLTDAGADPDAVLQRGWECLPGLRDTAATVFQRWAEMV